MDSQSAYQPVEENESIHSESKENKLRRWPATLLLPLMIGLPWLPRLYESPSLPLMMVSFMGPAGIGGLLLGWWLLASRAPWREKLVGFVSVLAIAILTISMLDKSMQGMGAIISVVPAGLAAFIVPLLALSAKPSLRLPVALLCSLLVFGYFELLQSKGVNGQFISETEWRWQPTAEEVYLESSASQTNKSLVETLEARPPITSESSEWSSFRGPLRDGKYSGVSLKEDWMATPPKLIWKRPIGPAWSSFSVAGDLLFTQEQRGENEVVICLDANTGDTVWVYAYPSRFWEAVAGAGPRATPTIADDGLFALGANGVLVALDARNGRLLWQTDLKTDADRQPPMWGFSSSPLVTGQLVIVHAGGQHGKGVIAYNTHDGQQVWAAASGDHSYSSAQLATFAGVEGILMETNAGLQFLDATTGKELWLYAWPIENYRALQPLVLGDTVLLAATLGGGTRRLAVSKDGEKWQVELMWQSRDLKPDFNDFVEHDGFLYGFDGNIFSCVDASSGQRKWKKGRYGSGQVLLLADADQLLVTSESGDLVLLRTNENQLEELGKFAAIEGKTWNHPVVIGNRVYLRNAENAACYELAVD